MFPIFYNSKKNAITLTTIKIPEGYKVESLPDALNISLRDNQVTYIVEVKESKGSIIVTIRYNRKVDTIATEDYVSFKTLISQGISKTKDRIVLAKI